MKKIKLVVIGCLMCATQLVAQQDALYTHYMYNTLAVNPGYAGSRDALTITALGRFQWVGFNGAPMTQTLTIHSPIAKKNIGLGLSVVNDKIGPTNNTGVNVDFAYRLKVGQRSRLNFGLKGGFNNFSAGLNSLTLHDDETDQSFSSGVRNKFLPNVGFGIYFQAEKFYAGLSAPKLLENDYAAGINISTEKRHYYFVMGGIIKLNPQLKFKPTLLAKMTESAPAQADATANFIINDIVTLGAMYRTGDAFGFLAGVNLTEQFAIGYSFDFSTTNRTGRYNAGSHELMLRYDFVFEKTPRIKSPRYF